MLALIYNSQGIIENRGLRIPPESVQQPGFRLCERPSLDERYRPSEALLIVTGQLRLCC